MSTTTDIQGFRLDAGATRTRTESVAGAWHTTAAFAANHAIAMAMGQPSGSTVKRYGANHIRRPSEAST